MAVPKLRFPEFTDDWEQRKLAELVTRYKDPVETPHDGYIRLGIRSHAKGTFHEYVEPGHELETAQMHRVAANKLIFNITFAWEHAVAITTEDDAGKLVSHRFPQFSLSELLRPEFLKYVILDEGFHHKLYLASPGGAGRNRVLKVDEALDYPIFFPSVEEQHKIGEFLNQLNDLITLHQRKLEDLRILKKSMLQKMFPAEGDNVPEIRFPQFTAAWEQRKCGDLLVERNTQAPQNDEYPLMAFIGGQGVAEKGNRYDRSALVKDEKGKPYKRTEFNDFIYSSNNLTTGSIGLNKYGKASISPVYSIFYPTGIADSDFIGRYMIRPEFIAKMIRFRQGVLYGQWRIHEDEFLNIDVLVPSLEEQRKIGTFFDNLDNALTLHQRKCDDLQKLKKALLQQMFC